MTQAKGKQQYFLGANAAQGFVSLYGELIDERGAAALYVLKGGAGCGKSTLMRTIGEEMERCGFAVEYILCSGDPDSLDAILIPEKAVAVVDGTAPHVIEPAYPGALGHYVNLGDFYDRARLHAHAEELVSLKQRHQATYAKAYQCLRAAQEVRRNGERDCRTEAALAKTKKRAKGILSRELKRKKGLRGTLRRRFLSAITCQGLLEFGDKLRAEYKRIYEIEEYGALASELLRDLQEGVLAAGYNAIACLAAEDPNRLAHLVVPELSLAFLTTRGTVKKEKRPYRRVRMESMLEREEIKLTRPQLRFAKRIAWELTADAIRALRKAKILHDEIEAIYHPFVKFEGIDRLTNGLIEEIKALPRSFRAPL